MTNEPAQPSEEQPEPGSRDPQEQSGAEVHETVTPSRKDRLRPLELIGFSGVLAVFTFLIVLMSTRDIQLALIFAGVAFIAALVMVALAGLGMKPNPEDLEARKNIENPH